MSPKKEPHVLLVDPNGETLTTLYSILDQEGCQVATSHPDNEALRYVAAHKPDVALVGRHPDDAPAGFLSQSIERLSPRTRILLFDPSQPWRRESSFVQDLVRRVKETV
ncbi:MAG TPA: hypothetical protein VEN81_04860 [Planctomycetota bacterium]|nr:hypothetical protein [Planctomycetota bacterium]